MTWADFKAAVTAAGILDTDEIDFIDVMDAAVERLTIHRDEDGRFCVTND